MGRKDLENIIIAACGLLLLAVASCKQPDPDCCKVPFPSGGEAKVYVVCEGSMGNGNSALTMYLPAKDSVYADVYKAVNQIGPGDVFQSMTAIGDNYFLCINNSDKILVIGKADWKLRTMISIPKPRYILPVNEDRAYVSTLFSNKIYVINPRTAQVLYSFSMPADNPEGMLLYNGKAFICTWDTATKNLYTVNTQTDQVSVAATLNGSAPQDAILDKEQKLWVLSGNVYKGKNAFLTRMDPATGQVLKTYAFPTGADPMRMMLNEAKDSLYFIEVNYNGGTQYNGIYRMNIADAQLPAQAFIQAQQNQYFWALGVEPGTGNIYVGDPKGFIQKGIVYIYQPNGALVRQFATGVGPGHFYFESK